MPDPLYSGRYNQAFALTPSDSATVQGPMQSGGFRQPYCSAILALTSGNITARFKDDHANAAVTFPVIAGTVYPFALAYVYTTSTATMLGLV